MFPKNKIGRYKSQKYITLTLSLEQNKQKYVDLNPGSPFFNWKVI